MISLGDICPSLKVDSSDADGYLIAKQPIQVKNIEYWKHSYTVTNCQTNNHSIFIEHMNIVFDESRVIFNNIIVYGNRLFKNFWDGSGISKGISLEGVSLTVIGETKSRFPLCIRDTIKKPVSLTGDNWSGVEQLLHANISWIELANARNKSIALIVTLWTLGNSDQYIKPQVRYNNLSCFLLRDISSEVNFETIKHIKGFGEFKRHAYYCPRDSKTESLLEIEGHGAPLRLLKISVGQSFYKQDDYLGNIPSTKHRDRRDVNYITGDVNSSKSHTPVNHPSSSTIKETITPLDILLNTTLKKYPVPSSSKSSSTINNSSTIPVVGSIFVSLLIFAGVLYTLKNDKSRKDDNKKKENEDDKRLNSQQDLTIIQKERQERKRQLKLVLEDSLYDNNATLNDDYQDHIQTSRQSRSQASDPTKNDKPRKSKNKNTEKNTKKKKNKKHRKSPILYSETTSDISFRTLINQPDYVSVCIFPGSSNTSRLAEREKELGIYEFQKDRSRSRSIGHIARKRKKSRRSIKNTDVHIDIIDNIASRTKAGDLKMKKTRSEDASSGRRSRNKTPKNSQMNKLNDSHIPTTTEDKSKTHSKKKSTDPDSIVKPLIPSPSIKENRESATLSTKTEVSVLIVNSDLKNNNKNNNLNVDAIDIRPGYSSEYLSLVHTTEHHSNRDTFSEVAQYYK